MLHLRKFPYDPGRSESSFQTRTTFKTSPWKHSNLLQIQQQQVETGDDSPDEEQGPVNLIDHSIWYIRTAGLQQSIIAAIIVYKYKKDESLIEGTECSFCLSEFQKDENLRCNHAFHLPCIWYVAPIAHQLPHAPSSDHRESSQGSDVISGVWCLLILVQREIIGRWKLMGER